MNLNAVNLAVSLAKTLTVTTEAKESYLMQHVLIVEKLAKFLSNQETTDQFTAAIALQIEDSINIQKKHAFERVFFALI